MEQRQRVDETNFLIDLEEVNLLAGNKVKSLLRYLFQLKLNIPD